MIDVVGDTRKYGYVAVSFLLIIQIPGRRIRRKALTASLYSQMRWKWKSRISIHLLESMSFESFRGSSSIPLRRAYTENFHPCSSLLRGQGSAPIEYVERCICLDYASQRRNQLLFGIGKKKVFQIKNRTDLEFDILLKKKRSMNWGVFFSCMGMFWWIN